MLRIVGQHCDMGKMNIFVRDTTPYMKGFLFACFTFLFIQSKAQDFNLTLITPQYHEGTAYLTYYYGKNMNVEDSAAVSSNGVAVFHKDKKVQPGVYSVVFPGKRFTFDFLIDTSRLITIIAKDTANLVLTSEVNNDKENDIFRDYQRFIATKGPLLEKEREAFKVAKNKKDSSLHEDNYRKLNESLVAYRENLITDNPESMLAALLKSMKEPTVLHPQPGNRQDTLDNYWYYRKHYWDGVTFNDARIIRTPFFLPRVERYFRQVINQDADSVIKQVDYYLLLSRTTPGMYRFLLNWFTDEYYQPKYMGQDKVFVHLFEKYHSKGVSDWLSKEQLKLISDRAYMVMSNLVGVPAAPLMMTDVAGKPAPLYNLKSDFTVVVFWDPTCGHCQHDLPRIDSIYQAKWKKENVRIYAVLTDNSVKPQWEKFIQDHKLGEWMHVYESDAQEKKVQSENQPSYRQLYDVIQTPTVYLLDKDKRIIAKKLTIEQLDDVISTKLKTAKKG